MSKISFQIPGASGTPEDFPAPSGIPAAISGGLDTTGKIFIQTSLNWLFILASVLAVIFIIYSGISWITSEGDPEKIALARKRLTYSIIGLVVVALAFLIVNVVIRVVGGNPTQLIPISR